MMLAAPAMAESCFEDMIVSPTPFMGNDGEIFRLQSGSVWQVKYEYDYLYEYLPSVTICPDLGKLLIKSKTLNVIKLSSGFSSSSASAEPPFYGIQLFATSQGTAGLLTTPRRAGPQPGWLSNRRPVRCGRLRCVRGSRRWLSGWYPTRTRNGIRSISRCAFGQLIE